MSVSAIRRAALAAVLLVLVVAVPAPTTQAAEPDAAAVAAGRAFLDRYVADDGRVVRHDQGGDTVSEGQAYALLIAAGLGDRDEFATIWGWTAAHLQRSDGLLAWRWANGAVADWMPAADADLATASALALASARFGETAYLHEARRIGAAVIANETAPVAGATTLLPGPWAVDTGHVNLSYFMVNAMSRLLWATGDQTWTTVAASARRLVAEQTAGGSLLPPDWNSTATTGAVAASSSPDGRSPRFGYEAARVLVQLAVDCRPEGRDLAAQSWRFFDDQDAGQIRAEYELSGAPLTDNRHPVTLVAAAASADAAGDHGAADTLLASATALDARYPTYYGSAWIALGRLWLDTPRLGGCRTP